MTILKRIYPGYKYYFISKTSADSICLFLYSRQNIIVNVEMFGTSQSLEVPRYRAAEILKKARRQAQL